MATIIYKPPTKGIGEGLGELLGAYTASKISDSRKKDRSEAIAAYLENIRSPTAQGQVSSESRQKVEGQLNPDDLLKLLMIAKKGQGDLTKVDAFTKEGKKVPYAASKSDIASGKAEQQAGGRGLTLVDPGKTKPGKPTDTDKSISDLLTSKQLPSTAQNRTKARSFLKDRRKAEDVINRSFGKKIGQDWMIEAGTKKEMADLATSQIEGLIFDEGLSAEQAGTVAVKIAQEAFKSRVEEEGAPIPKKDEGPGIADQLKSLLGIGDEGDTGGDAGEGGQSQQQQQQGNLEPLGNINGIDVSYPSTMTSPREIADYISKQHQIPFEDVRAWMIENQPIEQ